MRIHVEAAREILNRGARGVGFLILDYSCFRPIEQAIDRCPHQLDMPQLFGRDVGNQLIVRSQLLLAAHVHALEEVIVERTHLTETATH
jgi:hypothetical protein